MLTTTLARKLWVLVPLALLPALVGCGGDGYPDSLRYRLRSDPIIYASDLPRDEKGGHSLKVPDPPGTFPVMSMAQINDTNYPLHIVAGKAIDPRKLPADQRGVLETALEQVFGTPANPTVDVPRAADGNPEEGWEEVGAIVDQAHNVLKVDAETLKQGSRLYRIHCLHCHGLTGDGRGPTSFWINPHPRDYRPSTYKFTSTALYEMDKDGKLGQQILNRPQRGDLIRTLRAGIEGTAMPAFNLLPNHELEAMASYVIHLSLRGQVELHMISQFLGDAELRVEDFDEEVRKAIRSFTRQWLQAQGKIIPVPGSSVAEFAASVKRGESYWREWQCYVCHSDYGRQASFSYDNWGTLTRPANLTTGIFRGGRRPVDLYYRIYAGVNGTAMAANAPDPALQKRDPAKIVEKNMQIWDLVNFLQVLPYRSMHEQYGIKDQMEAPAKTDAPAKIGASGG